MRALLLLVLVLVAAGGGGYYWLLQQQEQARLAAETQEVVVAAPVERDVYVPAEDLYPGTILKPEHLERESLEEAAITPEMVPADADGEATLLGSVARRTLPAGAPVLRSAVVQPGERGFLAAVLPQGKRAISIPITEVGGISGLVLPGDRVDIILTYSVSADTIDSARDVKASETVLSNIRVLALDQRLHQVGPGEDGLLPGGASQIASTATLQVSPHEAEMVTLATTLGELSLVLNSVHDGGDGPEGASTLLNVALGPDAAERTMTLDSEVTSLLLRQAGVETQEERRQSIQIVRGNQAAQVEIMGQAIAAAAGAVLRPETSESPEQNTDVYASETSLGLDEGELIQ